MENAGLKITDYIFIALMLLGVGLLSHEVYIGDLEIEHALLSALCGAIFSHLGGSIQRR